MKNLLLSLLLVFSIGVGAAPITSTTTPETIYLFVVVLSKDVKDRTPYNVLYRTANKKECEEQALEWSTRLAPAKFVCLPHAQKQLKEIPEDE